MNVILIVAGKSNRFWPLKEKNTFPICGTTLVEHQIELLKDIGCTSKEIIVVVGKHNRKEISEKIKDCKIVEQENLDRGMQGALESALQKVQCKEIFVVSGNDIIEKSALLRVIETGKKATIDGVLLAKRVSAYFPGGYIVSKGSRITKIVEKPGKGGEPSDLVNIVVHFHRDSQALLHALQKSNGNDDGYEQAITSLLSTHNYQAATYNDSWFPVKYPWHLLDLLPQFLAKKTRSIHKKSSIHPTAVIDGPVVISEGVKVLAHATIVGPCYIGPNSIIANNTLVRESSIGECCVVGFGTEVARSILANNVWTHMSYVGDSILANNVSLGGGTTTGNLRLDEREISSTVQGTTIPVGRIKAGSMIGEHCRLGIHTAIAPGVKIGENSFIESACYLTEDIPDDSFVTMKNGVCTIRKNREQPLKLRK